MGPVVCVLDNFVSNKHQITFFEYILLIWLISIQIERMKKFAAMANKPRAEKIKLLKKDKWNAVYGLAFLTCLGMILLSPILILDFFTRNWYHFVFLSCEIIESRFDTSCCVCYAVRRCILQKCCRLSEHSGLFSNSSSLSNQTMWFASSILYVASIWKV